LATVIPSEFMVSLFHDEAINSTLSQWCTIFPTTQKFNMSEG